MAAVMPDSDSEDELPPGWEERATVDGSVYYVNNVCVDLGNGELFRSRLFSLVIPFLPLIRWLPPTTNEPLARINRAGWQWAFRAINSHATKGTQWTHPRTGKKKVVTGDLPFGWEKCVSEDGKIFYVDHANRRTTYSDPRLAFATEEKEHAQDFRQRFDGSTMALQVLHGRDLAGKVAIVTGANTGIGYETARSLALHGCTVVFACRNLEKAEASIERIKSERANAHCEALELELTELHKVKKFAANCKLRYKKIDMLILNAGVFGLSFSLTPDGYETTFQVNHLSQFYLTLLLEPLLTSNSRVVIVSSESHRFSNLSASTVSQSVLSPSSSTHFWSMMAYNNSKLCNVLFAFELARRWESKGITVNALHPGNMVSSDLGRHWWFFRLLFALVRPFTKSLQQAASTTVYCATAPDLEGTTGLYFNNCCRCEPSAAAQDPELARIVWEISDNMVQAVVGSTHAVEDS